MPSIKSLITNKLTPRQVETLDLIINYIESEGFPPTVRELQEKLRVSSVRGASVHLDALEKKGFIQRNSKARGIRVLRRPMQGLGNGTIEIPLVGQIAAGTPILAEENIEKYVSIRHEYLRGAEKAFLLRVQGESMIEAGIAPGDLAIVIPTETAQNGDLVVALMEDEATLKKFHQVEDYVALIPANPKYEPIIGHKFSVQGRVIGIIRQGANSHGSLLRDSTLVPIYRVGAKDYPERKMRWAYGAGA